MTPERIDTLRRVLALRQPDLSVVMDNVHKPHNFSAVLRSCDAVGVLEAHAVWPSERLRPLNATSGGAGKWLRITTHRSVHAALDRVAASGMQVIAANAGGRAVDFREIDYARPTAVLLGAELQGVSEEALSRCDAEVAIPMLGMAESLNVSVAAAVILFEAQRQRLAAGLYERCRVAPELHAEILFEWAHPEVASHCRRHGLAYPAMDPSGQIDPAFRGAVTG